MLAAVMLYCLLGFGFSHGSIETIDNIMSVGIAQMIDSLTDQYHMRFTVVSTGSNDRIKDLACKIVKATKSAINSKHSNEINASELIDFDESYFVLSESGHLVPRHFERTNYLTHRHRLAISMTIDLRDEYSIEELEYAMNLPHDFYEVHYSPFTGSLWLHANILFFNGTCRPRFRPINKFDSSKMKWIRSKFMNEYKQFNNCLIEIGQEDSLEAIPGLAKDEPRNKLINYLDSILDTFSKHHKIMFKTYTSFSSDYYFKQSIFPGTADASKNVSEYNR